MPVGSAQRMTFSVHRPYYRYYRLRITATQGLGLVTTIGKIQLFGQGRNGMNVLTTSAPTWASSLSLGSSAANVLDLAQTSTAWTSAALAGMPQWIEIDAGQDIAIDKFVMTPSTNVLQLGDTPSTFTLQGSNDRASYTDLRSYSTSWSSVAAKTFDVL